MVTYESSGRLALYLGLRKEAAQNRCERAYRRAVIADVVWATKMGRTYGNSGDIWGPRHPQSATRRTSALY